MSLVGKLVVVIRGPFEGFRGVVRLEGRESKTGQDLLEVSLTNRAFDKAYKILLNHLKTDGTDLFIGMHHTMLVRANDVEVIS